MAIQFMDDFTSYGTDSSRVSRLLNGTYAEANLVDLTPDPDINIGSAKYCMQLAPNLTTVLRKTLTSVQTTVGAAFRLWCTALPSGAGKAFSMYFLDTNNLAHVYYRVNPSGYLEAYRVDIAGDILLGTSTSPITANSWRHLEIRVLISATVGTIDIRMEGVSIMALSGIRTASNVVASLATCQNVSFFNNSSAPNAYLKDLILWDGSTALNNTFLGTCQVLKLVPATDVALNWAASGGGTGFSKINETSPDDDTAYITATTPPPAAYQATLTQLPASVTAVKGVQVIHRSRKIDGGTGNIQSGLISGANTGLGVDRPITTSYTYVADVFDQDPGAIPWTKTLVNALKLQLNRTI